MEPITDEQLQNLLTYWGGEPVNGLSGRGRDTMAATLLPALRELLALREQNRWIPEAESKPEIGKLVLVGWGSGVFAGTVNTGKYYGVREENRGHDWSGFRPTHWRPLPAPPEG